MGKRAADGAGSVRKKTVTRKGKQYTYWEARYSAGYDPGTGKQIQRSVTGHTQKEVAEKLRAATASIDAGTYTAPCKLTVGEWLDVWAADYLGGVKASTVDDYKRDIQLYIRPALGAVRLDSLPPHAVQQFYNSLTKPRAGGRPPLSPSTVRQIHAVLHRALKQAVRLGYIHYNPVDACTLPRKEKRAIHPFGEDEIAAFLKAASGHRMETLFEVAIFTGMREGEITGLTWDDVDFERGVIQVSKQLQHIPGTSGYSLVSPKSGKGRTISPAPWVMARLKRLFAAQAEQRLKVGELWEDGGFVFTDGVGHYLTPNSVYHQFKCLAASIGRPDARFHDLRHTYAVTAIRAGDDIKTIQGNLGHATAAFTLDVYGHLTEQMKRDSAQRMENYIQNVLCS